MLVILVAAASSQLTRYLVVHRGLGTVRASAAATLAFLALTAAIPAPETEPCRAAFLGASFLGMSSAKHFSARDIFFAAMIFAALFLLVLPYNAGLGGALGLAAFTSCLLIRGLRPLIDRAVPRRH
jgi:hypothetical protein